MASIFSTLWDDAKNLFNSVAGKVPAAQQALSDLQKAENSALAAIDPIADSFVNAGLAEVPLGLGTLTEPFVDALANSILDKLKAKLAAPAS
jgi:hypothetical protein